MTHGTEMDNDEYEQPSTANTTKQRRIRTSTEANPNNNWGEYETQQGRIRTTYIGEYAFDEISNEASKQTSKQATKQGFTRSFLFLSMYIYVSTLYLLTFHPFWPFPQLE